MGEAVSRSLGNISASLDQTENKRREKSRREPPHREISDPGCRQTSAVSPLFPIVRVPMKIIHLDIHLTLATL